MSFLRKRGDKWHIEYVHPRTGKRASKSTDSTRKDVAKEIQKKIDDRISLVKAGVILNVEDKITLRDFIKRYKQYAEATKAPTTAKRDIDALEAFTDFSGNVKLSMVHVDNVEQYRQQRLTQVAPGTVNLEIRHLKAAFNVAKSWRLLETNPFAGLKMIKVPESDVARFLEKEHIIKLREAITDDPFAPIIKFYMLTGARLREGVDLMGEDIDFRRGLIHLRGSKTKSKRNRTIPFKQMPELHDLLKNQHPETGKPVFPSLKNQDKPFHHTTVAHHIKRVFKSIGLHWASTHTLRHTFASHMVMSGVEMWTVSKLLGHSSISVTEKHYAHLAPKHAEEAMAMLPYQTEEKKDD